MRKSGACDDTNGNGAADQRFDRDSRPSLDDCPDPGWIRTIRDALGMSSRRARRRGWVLSQPARLAARTVGASPGRIRLDSLSPGTLPQLDVSKLVYSLVPRVSLEETLDHPAHGARPVDGLAVDSSAGRRNQD